MRTSELKNLLLKDNLFQSDAPQRQSEPVGKGGENLLTQGESNEQSEISRKPVIGQDRVSNISLTQSIILSKNKQFMRYSQLSENEAAIAFENRKKELMLQLMKQVPRNKMVGSPTQFGDRMKQIKSTFE